MYMEGRERRRAHRIRVPGGKAVCRSDSLELACAVLDASPEGIALALAGAGELRAGASVSLDLEWPGIGQASCEGRVVRGTRQSVIAVAFSSRDRGFEALITALACLQRAASDESVAVVYAPEPWEVGGVVAAFDDLGMKVARAGTCLEVLWRFDGRAADAGVLLFDASAASLEMARFIGEEFPRVRRVLVVARDQLESGCGACELGFCDAVVAVDASAVELAAALNTAGSECLSCGGVIVGEAVFCSGCRDRSRQSSLTVFDDLGVGD